MIFGRLIGKAVCRFNGHKRGERIHGWPIEVDPRTVEGMLLFSCPRCGAQWTRKVAARKPKQTAIKEAA